MLSAAAFREREPSCISLDGRMKFASLEGKLGWGRDLSFFLSPSLGGVPT